MKKSIFLLAAFALLAASCTKTELVSSGALSSQKGIGFSAYTAKPTKAAQTDVITDDFNSFQVSAIGNGAVYFDNVTFRKVSTVWESDPLYFWPAYELDFYAYNTPSHGTFTRTINATDPQTLTFTPSTVLTEQEDLVAACAENQTQPVSGATDITFNHYLTQIVVKALNTNPTYSVEVAGVKIAHMKNKVKYTFSSNTADVATDAADQTYSSEFTANAKTLDADAQEVMTASTGNKWYLVPQTVTAWDQAGDQTNTNERTYLALKVKITANGGALRIYPATGDDYAWMAIPLSQTFSQGHKYTFVVKFFESNGAGYVDPEAPGDLDGNSNAEDDKGKSIIGGAITFKATVNTWAPETEIVIEL